MTRSLELAHPHNTTPYGDEALEIINRHRYTIHDHFRVDELGDEFPRLEQHLGASSLYLARAGDNDAGAFKVRGALAGATALQRLGVESLTVPSAGNHARGAIIAARILDMGIDVVVPQTAPPAKKEGLRGLWDDPTKLRVHAVGTSFNDSLDWALSNPNLTGELLHPFDDQYVMAGQGTLIDDILAEQEEVEHIVAPVGGAGLVAGMMRRLQELDRSDVTIHAVEAPGSNSLSLSLATGEPTDTERPNKRYGGSAVKRIGIETFRICQNYPNLNVLAVTDDAVDEIIDDYDQDRHDLDRLTTPHYEPTTLVSLAGLTTIIKRYPRGIKVVIGTGHNDSLYPPPMLPQSSPFPTFRS